MAKSVRDTMTAEPRSIEPSQPIVEAARLMRDEDVGSLPVTEEGRLNWPLDRWTEHHDRYVARLS